MTYCTGKHFSYSRVDGEYEKTGVRDARKDVSLQVRGQECLLS